MRPKINKLVAMEYPIIFNPKKYASGKGIDANVCSILQPLHLSQNSLAFISFLESTTTRAWGLGCDEDGKCSIS